MRLATAVSLSLLSAALLLACDDSADTTEAQASVVAVAEQAADEAEVESAEVESAEAESAEAHPCQPHADRMKAATSAVLEELSVELEDFDGWFENQTRSFLNACQENLTDEQRDCLLNADDIMAMAGICGVPDMTPNQRPRVPDLHRVWRPASELSEEESAAQLARMVGTWHNAWESANEETTWTIAEDGSMEHVFTRRGNTEESERQVSFLQEHLVSIDNLQGSVQRHSFAQVSDDLFYSSGNLLYSAHPMPSRDSFQIVTSHFAILYDEGDCDVLSASGARGEISCEFTQDGGAELFSATYTVPTSLDRNGDLREHAVSFRVYDGLLIDSNMQAFARQ